MAESARSSERGRLRHCHCGRQGIARSAARTEVSNSLLTDVRDLGRRASELERSIAALVVGHPLLELPGVGILPAARLVAETGDVARFRSPAAFAMLAGVAPIPASSGETQRMRLNRGGNRRPNRALYTIALSQAWHHEPANAYIDRKRASGKSWALASWLRDLATKLGCREHLVSTSPHKKAKRVVSAQMSSRHGVPDSPPLREIGTDPDGIVEGGGAVFWAGSGVDIPECRDTAVVGLRC